MTCMKHKKIIRGNFIGELALSNPSEVPEGEVPEGEVPEGEVPEGEASEGEAPEGDPPEGEAPEGGGSEYGDSDLDAQWPGASHREVADLSPEYLPHVLKVLEALCAVARGEDPPVLTLFSLPPPLRLLWVVLLCRAAARARGARSEFFF